VRAGFDYLVEIGIAFANWVESCTPWQTWSLPWPRRIHPGCGRQVVGVSTTIIALPLEFSPLSEIL